MPSGGDNQLSVWAHASQKNKDTRITPGVGADGGGFTVISSNYLYAYYPYIYRKY